MTELEERTNEIEATEVAEQESINDYVEPENYELEELDDSTDSKNGLDPKIVVAAVAGGALALKGAYDIGKTGFKKGKELGEKAKVWIGKKMDEHKIKSDERKAVKEAKKLEAQKAKEAKKEETEK